MRALQAAFLVLGLSLGGVSASEAKQYAYGDRGQFCQDLITSLVVGDKKQSESLLRDNSLITGDRMDSLVAQFAGLSATVASVTKGKLSSEPVLAKQEDLKLVDKRYYLMEVPEGLALFYCLVRKNKEAIHLITFSFTTNESDLNKFFDRGW